MVGRWLKASENWNTKINQDSKQIGLGRKAFYLETEGKLYTWVIEQRKQELAVTYMILRVKMQEIIEISEMVNLYGDSAKDFRISD